MSSQRRSFKIAEKIQFAIASKLIHVSDPRLFLVTITGVKISPDLKVAKIYWMVTGGRERLKEVEAGFDAAKGFLRSAVGKELGLKVTPELRFYYDDTLDEQERVDKLFEKIK